MVSRVSARRIPAPGRHRISNASRALVATALLGWLVLGTVAGGLAAPAATPEGTVKTFLRTVYARDYPGAYALISAEDRTVKTKEAYVRENGAFTGVTLKMARALASLIRFERVRTVREGDRATVTFRAILPNADAPEIQTLLLEFDDERLAALSVAERRARVRQLQAMAREGRLPVIVSEHEQWELVREDGVWRVFLNWAGAVTVRFEAMTTADLPWAFAPVQPVIRAKPGETLQAYYRVKNLGDQEITGKARHVLDPPEETGHLQIVSCFCFLQQTLKPGEEQRLPVTFRVDYELPGAIRELRVRYEFYPLDRFPEGERR